MTKRIPKYPSRQHSSFVDKRGYVQRKTSSGRAGKESDRSTWRDWQLVMSFAEGKNEYGKIYGLNTRLPPELIGKRVRIRIESVKYGSGIPYCSGCGVLMNDDKEAQQYTCQKCGIWYCY